MLLLLKKRDLQKLNKKTHLTQRNQKMQLLNNLKKKTKMKKMSLLMTTILRLRAVLNRLMRSLKFQARLNLSLLLLRIFSVLLHLKQFHTLLLSSCNVNTRNLLKNMTLSVKATKSLKQKLKVSRSIGSHDYYN